MKKDVGELGTSVKELKEKIADRSKRHSQYEINFVMSHNNIICCFVDKLLLLTDTAFNPLYIYETTSYINACTISDTAKYILCQTANNRENDEDSGATIIIDVKSETVLSKKSIETGWKGVRHLFIDENNMTFFAYYDDKQVKYDFNCNLLSKKSVAAKVAITPQGQKTMYDKAREQVYADKDWGKELNARNKARAGITTDPNEFVPKRKTANGENPYEVERNALSLLQELHTGYDVYLEAKILNLFENIKNCLYPNRLALNYKLLGDTLAQLNMTGNAIKAYETGLTLNPNLPVKKKLQALKRANAI